MHEGFQNKMVVRFSSYMFQNWAYIILSGVVSLRELFICERILESKSFGIDPNLFKEEGILLHIGTKWTAFSTGNSKYNI